MQEGKIMYEAIDFYLNYLQQCNRISSHIKLKLDCCSRGNCKYMVGYFYFSAQVISQVGLPVYQIYCTEPQMSSSLFFNCWIL